MQTGQELRKSLQRSEGEVEKKVQGAYPHDVPELDYGLPGDLGSSLFRGFLRRVFSVFDGDGSGVLILRSADGGENPAPRPHCGREARGDPRDGEAMRSEGGGGPGRRGERGGHGERQPQPRTRRSGRRQRQDCVGRQHPGAHGRCAEGEEVGRVQSSGLASEEWMRGKKGRPYLLLGSCARSSRPPPRVAAGIWASNPTRPVHPLKKPVSPTWRSACHVDATLTDVWYYLSIFSLADPFFPIQINLDPVFLIFLASMKSDLTDVARMMACHPCGDDVSFEPHFYTTRISLHVAPRLTYRHSGGSYAPSASNVVVDVFFICQFLTCIFIYQLNWFFISAENILWNIKPIFLNIPHGGANADPPIHVAISMPWSACHLETNDQSANYLSFLTKKLFSQ